MIDKELFTTLDWQDHGEYSLALETAEATFAERCYLENHPPLPTEWVMKYTRAIPALTGPSWPIWAKYELLFRCFDALRSIQARDESYPYYRDIYTPEQREAARERRVRAKRTAKDWRETGNQVALEDMLEALDEIHAERGVL